MRDRPYKCPLCHSVFKTESGMKWHIAHQHEIPAAFDTLGKQYEAKTVSLQEENDRLRKKLDQIQRELEETRLTLIEEKAARIEVIAEIARLRADLNKAMFGLASRDHILQEKLNIQLESPFE